MGSSKSGGATSTSLPKSTDLVGWATLLLQRYDECDGALVNEIFGPNAHIWTPDGSLLEATAANYTGVCLSGATIDTAPDSVKVSSSPAPTDSTFLAFATLDVGGQEDIVQINCQKVGDGWLLSAYRAGTPGPHVDFS